MFKVIPVPYEATTTYGKGTKYGPEAILEAIKYVENFDEELKTETFLETDVEIGDFCELKDLATQVDQAIESDKFPVVLGGEHSLTPFAVQACAKYYKKLSVLQLDAHADLRDSFQGSKQNHGCVMRRVLEICPAVQVGVRSISTEGYKFAKKTKQLKKIHFAHEQLKLKKILKQLSKNVYITIDVDVFDPSVVPAVGTPEPGGYDWYKVLEILRTVIANKNVVGFDVVELSPRKDDLASDFTVAKLIYKLIGYLGL